MCKGIIEYRIAHFRFLLAPLLCFIFILFSSTLPIQINEFAIAKDHNRIQQSMESYYNYALEALEQKDFSSAEDHLRKVIAENSHYQEPSGRSAWYWLGFVFEQLDQPYDAIEIWEQGLDSLQSCSISDLYLKYHLARLYAENQILKQNEQITRLSYDVFNKISPIQQPDLWKLLLDQAHCLLTEDEINEIEQLQGKSEARAGKLLVGAFRRHDPTPLSLTNEFLIAYFQRAAEARKQYGDVLPPRGYDTRGDLYVRLGKPYKILYDHSGTRGAEGYIIRPYEFWFYFNINPDLYFTFLGKTSKADFRLVDGPESLFGDFYRTIRTPYYFHRDLYLSLAPIHKKFRTRLQQFEELGSSADRHFTADDRIYAAYRDSILQSLVFGADFTQENIPLKLVWSRFLADKEKIRIEFYYSISLNDLEFQYSSPNYYTSVHSQIGIFNEDYDFIHGDSLIERLELPSVSEVKQRNIISQWTFELNPGKYHSLFRFDNPEGEKQQIFRVDLQLDAFPDTLLCMSDIQLATEVYRSKDSARFTKHGYFVKPLLRDRIPNNQPFFVYFEIYRLSRNQLGETKYQIEYQLFESAQKRGAFDWLRNLFKPKQVIQQVYQNRVQRTGQNPFQPDYQELVFPDLKEDEYQLHISITDLNSTEKVSNKITINLGR